MSAIAGPDISAAAAEAAVTAICNETSCPREIFDGQKVTTDNTSCALTGDNKPERYDHKTSTLPLVIDYYVLYFMILTIIGMTYLFPLAVTVWLEIPARRMGLVKQVLFCHCNLMYLYI